MIHKGQIITNKHGERFSVRRASVRDNQTNIEVDYLDNLGTPLEDMDREEIVTFRATMNYKQPFRLRKPR